MAAVFVLDITKQHHSTLESWGNRYLIETTDLTAAASAVPIVVAAEKAFHFDCVDFLSARVSTDTPDDGLWITVPLEGHGGQISTGKTMPLFLAMEARFLTSGFGPTLLKYYHTGFDDVFYDADFTYDDALLTDALDALTAMISDLADNDTTYVKREGVAATIPTIKTRVLAHQFTKASKRAVAGP
jgi:hypothetical protein